MTGVANTYDSGLILCNICRRDNIERDIYLNHCSECKYYLCLECEINNYALKVDHIESTEDIIQN